MNRLRLFIKRTFPNIIFPRYITQANKEYRKQISKNIDINEVKNNLDSNLSNLYDEWAEAKASKLLMKARRYDLEIPIKYVNGDTLSCYYNESSSIGSVMNSKGRNFLRKQSAEFEKNHREKWIGLISVIFGLLGGVTGLIAVIKS